MVDILLGTLCRRRSLGTVLDSTRSAMAEMTNLVSKHQNVRMVHKVSVDIFECPTSGFRVEQIDQRHECSVEHSPDNIELPAEGVDTNWRDLHYDEIA